MWMLPNMAENGKMPMFMATQLGKMRINIDKPWDRMVVFSTFQAQITWPTGKGTVFVADRVVSGLVCLQGIPPHKDI